MIKIPKITLQDQLNGLGNDISFTIFDPENSYYNINQVAEMYSAVYGGDMNEHAIDFIAFRPARILNQEIIIALTTSVKIKNLNEDLQQKFNLIEQLADSARLEALGDHLYNQCLSSSAYEINIRNRYLPGRFVSNITIVEVKSLIAFAKYSNEKLRLKAKDIVAKAISESNFETLPEYEIDKRITFTVNGPIASGKGSFMVMERKQAGKFGLAWETIAKINGDSYKLLLNPGYRNETSVEKLHLFSQVVQDEITIINKEINQRFFERLNQTGKAANIFVDKSLLNDFAIDLACMGGGKIYGFLVHVSAEEAMKRAEERGSITGRYEDTYSILEAHSMIATKFTNLLKNHYSKPIFYTIFDNEVLPDMEPIKAATVDLKAKKIMIYDEGKLFKFLNKSNLNVEKSILAGEIIYDNISWVDMLMAGIVDAGYQINYWSF
jgi:hypothetical protein